MRLWASFVVLMLASGCLGGRPTPSEPTDDPAGSPTGTPNVPVEYARPTWTVGQGWTYSVEIPGQQTRTFQMMVAEDRAQSNLWVVASSDRAQAIHHAVYSANPVLGRIGKETLAPFQGGAPVEMFKFPFTDEKTWQAKFFNEQSSFVARFAGDIDVSRLPRERGLGDFAEGFRITATGSSGQRVLYDYVAAVEWFTSFEIINKDGQRVIKLTLTDFEQSYRGPYFFFRGIDLVSEDFTHSASEVPTTASKTAAVPEDFKDHIALGAIYSGRAGTPPPTVDVALKNPSNQEVWKRQYTTNTQVSDLQDFPGVVGTWTAEIRLVGNVDLALRVVGIQRFAEGAL